jgi:hypothetical protein
MSGLLLLINDRYFSCISLTEKSPVWISETICFGIKFTPPSQINPTDEVRRVNVKIDSAC